VEAAVQRPQAQAGAQAQAAGDRDRVAGEGGAS
jgi:hypothetical protein